MSRVTIIKYLCFIVTLSLDFRSHIDTNIITRAMPVLRCIQNNVTNFDYLSCLLTFSVL